MTESNSTSSLESDKESESSDEILSILRCVDESKNGQARPMAVVQVEKFYLNMKEPVDLSYKVIETAFRKTDGDLCLYYEDTFGHGYIGLLEGELTRYMQIPPSQEYNTMGLSPDKLRSMLKMGDVNLCLRKNSPLEDAES